MVLSQSKVEIKLRKAEVGSWPSLELKLTKEEKSKKKSE